jgi:hypothetical protein
MTCERVCVLVDVDEGNNEGVCGDVLGYGKNRNSSRQVILTQMEPGVPFDSSTKLGSKRNLIIGQRQLPQCLSAKSGSQTWKG